MRSKAIVPLVVTIALLSGAEAMAADHGLLRWMRSKPIIDSIVIEGNEHFGTGQIRKRMYSRKRNVWGWLKGDRRTRLQRETLDRDTLEIKYFYLLNGYLAVQVNEGFEVSGRDSSALVRVRLREGDQFRYGPRALAGNFDQKFSFNLNKIASRLRDDRPIDLFAVRQAAFDMRTLFANEGYPYARIDYRFDTVSGRPLTPITFEIEADSLVHIGEITIEGTNRYPAYTARRELKLKKGAIYRRQDILDSQSRLFESGYFSTFQLGQSDSLTNRYQPGFAAKVRERRPLYFTFETGAAQSQERDLEWSFSTAFGKRNLLGSRSVELLADYAFSVGKDARLLTHKYRLRFTEPWFLGFRMPLSLTGELNPRLKDPTQEFDKQSWVVAVATTKRFGPKIKVNLGLEYQSVDISGIPEDQIQLIKQQKGNSARRKLYFNIRQDTREDLLIPRSGSVTEFSSEVFGGFLGGDASFFKLQASWSRYQLFWPGWIAATRFKVGWAKEFGSSTFVPSDELLYLGGANTVRGFRENYLGPLLPDGTPKGARQMIIFNQEFRWKTFQVFHVIPILSDLFRAWPLWQSIFFDMGNGFDTPRMSFTVEDFAYIYGMGVQLASPAGPIRLDYARRIKTRNFAFESRWHFTILYAF